MEWKCNGATRLVESLFRTDTSKIFKTEKRAASQRHVSNSSRAIGDEASSSLPSLSRLRKRRNRVRPLSLQFDWSSERLCCCRAQYGRAELLETSANACMKQKRSLTRVGTRRCHQFLLELLQDGGDVPLALNGSFAG